ncbi:MAG: DUF177 domain-containing protein [Chloroflexota bacterium]|nr:DUF177 domain-containing protein [Chloroflexota bacterium]
MVINVAPLLKQPLGTRVDYDLTESPVDPRGENAGLLEASIVDIEALVHATHTNPGAYFEGSADGHVAAQCARCLTPIEAPVHADFAEQYFATAPVEHGVALVEPPLDAKTIGADFKVDLVPLLREELILVTPVASLCREDCAGLCPVCGDDLNERPHAHEETVDGRWGALQELKDKIAKQ